VATRANSKVADFLFYGICGCTGKPAFKDERARVTARDLLDEDARRLERNQPPNKHTGCGER